MTERNPSAKVELFYTWERLNDSLDGCLLLFLNGSLNDEQKLAILACSLDNYRRLPAERILAVLLTIWFTPISRREEKKNFLSVEVR